MTKVLVVASSKPLNFLGLKYRQCHFGIWIPTKLVKRHTYVFARLGASRCELKRGEGCGCVWVAMFTQEVSELHYNAFLLCRCRSVRELPFGVTNLPWCLSSFLSGHPVATTIASLASRYCQFGVRGLGGGFIELVSELWDALRSVKDVVPGSRPEYPGHHASTSSWAGRS